MKFRFSKPVRDAWPAILLGVVAFVTITGGTIIRPTYVDWLMEGDPAQHWLGWRFFRHSPLLQWPIGANPNYGLDMGSSIVLTDSLPLLAIIFKPLSPLLPDAFQYFGLWILLCFVLQSFFAWKLLSLFASDKWLPLIGSAFFLLAPACLWRLSGHYALFGHWMLLAGLYFYLSTSTAFLRWMLLLSAAALVHAYLLIMVFGLWSADLIQRRLRNDRSTGEIIIYVLAGAISTTVTMWAAGYFMLTHGVGDWDFGVYRMNLLSLIDPDADWSKLLRDQAEGAGDYEGFSFLGVGMLGLAFIAVYELVRGTGSDLLRDMRTGYAKIAPLILLSAGLFLYSISNHVAIGSDEMFSYGLHGPLKTIAGTFRSSGRFFWPVYYLIYVVIFHVIFSRLRHRSAVVLCVSMLVIQCIDSSERLLSFRSKFTHASNWWSPMRSPLWADIARRYKRIAFVLPQNASPDWMPLADFAATNGMAINTGYFARVNQARVNKARVQMVTSIMSGVLDADSLYVFEDGGLWRFAATWVAPTDVAGILDGFRLVAPKLRDCAGCELGGIASISAGGNASSGYQMERISFAATGTGQEFAVYGWSAPEEGGTWSDGDAAAISLRLSSRPQSDLELVIEGHAFVNERHPTQEIRILVNEHVLGTLGYESPDSGMLMIRIPRATVSEDGHLLIQFEFATPESPVELGMSDDDRRLGFHIVSMQLQEVGSYDHVLEAAGDEG